MRAALPGPAITQNTRGSQAYVEVGDATLAAAVHAKTTPHRGPCLAREVELMVTNWRGTAQAKQCPTPPPPSPQPSPTTKPTRTRHTGLSRMFMMCIHGCAGWGQIAVSMTDCAVRSPNSRHYGRNINNSNVRPCTHEYKVGEDGGGWGKRTAHHPRGRRSYRLDTIKEVLLHITSQHDMKL